MRTRSVLLATTMVLGAGLVGGIVLSTPGGPSSNSGKINLIAFTGGDHGSVEAKKSNVAPYCLPNQLTSDFWTTLSGSPGQTVSGFTVTNTSSNVCALPTAISKAEIVDAAKQPVSQPGFAATSQLPVLTSGTVPQPPSASSLTPEFGTMELSASEGVQTVEFGLPGVPVQIQQLELNPEGKAVVVIVSFFDPSTEPAECIAPPGGGSIDIGLDNQTMLVPVPLMPAPAGGPENSTGSSFYECSTSAISPFVTWDQAVQMAGGSALVIGPQGPLPNVDNPIFARAP